MTDQLSIGDWDPPFPFDSGRVRDKDEQYWDEHRTTPKAFVSLAAGRKLWSSRFGNTTAVRFAPPPGPTLQAQADQLRARARRAGVSVSAGQASGPGRPRPGTTAFDGLFLGFSLFIMVAALLLVALLFRLGIEQRAPRKSACCGPCGLRSGRILGVLAARRRWS